jgi:hypothetical protein
MYIFILYCIARAWTICQRDVKILSSVSYKGPSWLWISISSQRYIRENTGDQFETAFEAMMTMKKIDIAASQL